MSEKTYLFYDLETTGLSKAFDQVLQFAAIRTDMQFNEIARYEIEIELLPDVVPSPMALITHRIPLDGRENTLKDAVGIYRIHEMINYPGTISCGYNTLGFDDEFLRFSFYKNLLNPYTHQYANDCSRMDVFPMLVYYYLYAKDSMQWAEGERNSLKLEDIAKANKIEMGRAHDALNDVEATVSLAKKMAKANPKMWKYLAQYFNKNEDFSRIASLPEAFSGDRGHHLGLLIDSKFGHMNFYQRPVMCIGRHNHYKNQFIWLCLDNPELQSCGIEDLAMKGCIYRKKLAEPGFVLPLKDRYTQRLSAERCVLMKSNLSWLEKNMAHLVDISHYYREYVYPSLDNLDLDAALYDAGFRTDEEERVCEHFIAAPAEVKHKLLDKFDNEHMCAQALRYLWRNYFEHLPEIQREKMKVYTDILNVKSVDEAVVDYRGKPRLLPQTAWQETQDLLQSENMDLEQQQLLKKLGQYLEDNFLINTQVV